MFESKFAAPGVRVVSVKTDRFKTNEIDVSMAVPLDENAAAYALLIALLKRSCKAYPDFTKLNGKLDELYGASIGFGIGKCGDAQVLSLYCECIDDKFSLDGSGIVSECIELLCNMIFAPNAKFGSFGNENLALEKRLLQQKILEEQDDKRSYAFDKCIECMCPNEPFGKSVYGTSEEVENVKMADVYAAWKTLISKAVFQITVVGSTDINVISEAFEKNFAKIQREPFEIKTIFFKKGAHFTRTEERVPVNQGKLVIGYRTGMENSNDNLFAERVMVDIFGGGTYSKLFSVIREKMSLAYYCNARLIRSKGIVIVQSGIDTDKEKAVSAGIIKQLIEVRTGKFDDEILASSKRSLREGLTLTTPSAICGWYSRQILEESLRTPEEMIDGIEKVTKQEVCDAAAKMSIDKIFMLAADETEESSNEN